MTPSPHITRVVLRNYKSISHGDVRLGSLTFLTGPNGAGKSNFLEALRFLSWALTTSLEQAIENRAGYHTILHRPSRPRPGTPSTILFEVHLALDENAAARYLVEIEGRGDQPVTVVKEECTYATDGKVSSFKVARGKVFANVPTPQAVSEEKLYLSSSLGSEFEPVYRALSAIAVYNPLADEIRGFKPQKRYRYLDRTASALAEVIFKLKKTESHRLPRVIEYLRKINPSIIGVEPVSVDDNYNLRFILDRDAGVHEEFPSQNMSDGTLKALAVLMALFQKQEPYPLTLIGLEEPEACLHPAATNVLFDSLLEASTTTQVVVTSHSPDLLDRSDIPDDALRAVVSSLL